MKSPLYVLSLALVTIPAFAAQKAPFEKLKADAKEYVQLFDNQTEECDVRVKETRNGLTLSVKKPKEAVVYFDVADDAQITVKGDKSQDDSFSHVYTVKGEGKVEFVHVDDAYDHMYVTKDGKTTSCELDY